MDQDRKKRFIVNVLYVGIIILLTFAVLRYALPLVMPFVIGFVLAWLLRRPTVFLARVLHLPEKLVGGLLMLLFYCTAGLLIALAGIRLASALWSLMLNLPGLYTNQIQPFFIELFDAIEQAVQRMNPSLVSALEQVGLQFLQTLGQLISSLSGRAISILSGGAASLPGLLIRLLLLIISSFFVAMDYRRITEFSLRQLSPSAQHMVLEIKDYVTGTLFVCIRSYALIMFITFVELSLGLTLIGVGNAVVVAAVIAVFDILPVLGTGGIMIPWAVISALRGDLRLALSLLAVYGAVTVIRNIIEPKIVGSQIGLHPVATLASMFVGLQLFGVVGLFGFPICLSLLLYLSRTGAISLFK